MKIRKATDTDAEAVLRLRNDSIRKLCEGFYSKEVLSRWTDVDEPSPEFIEFVRQLLYVVESEGIIVACGAIDWTTSKIDAVFVAPQHKNKGIGREIVEFLEGVAIQNSAPGPLIVEATLNAAPFYRKLGFIGESISQYHSPRGFSMDCVEMKKTLRTPA